MSLPRGQIKDSNLKGFEFLLFQSHHDDYYNMSADAVRGIQEETVLSKLFFHPDNVDLIQRMIIKKVFDESTGKYLIEKQDESDLEVIMRSIFLQHARHVASNIPGQIYELNCFVVDDVVPGIMSMIDSQFGYLERTFGPRQIMDNPECASNAGLRTLPSVTRTFK